MSPAIPATIEAVDNAWMTDVLRASGALASGEVASMEQVRIGEGIGIMGDIFRSELTYDGGTGPASVVVKLPSLHEDNRAQGVALGMYEAEVRFYAELGERTGAGLPDIHLATIESGTADFVIVMEDLSRFEMVDQQTGMNPAQAGAAVRVLADVHAAWWDRVQTDELAWIPSMVGERITMVDQMMGQIYPVFIANFGDRLPDGGRELGDRFSTSYLRLNKILADRAPWTLAHQDYRVENLLFGDPAADEVAVIDWQGIGRGPGAYDLAYTLGGSMEIDLRREHERALVTEYHDRLVANGVNDYSADQAWDDYGFAHLLGGLATSVFTGGTLDLSNERGVELIATMSDRHFTAALDHGGLDLMG